MTTHRYALRDDQWERIQDLLPGRVACVGVTAKDNRLFVEAVLYRYRAGIPIALWAFKKGETCQCGSAISVWCTHALVGGAGPASGSVCFSTWQTMPTMNMP
jgi:transposase